MQWLTSILVASNLYFLYYLFGIRRSFGESKHIHPDEATVVGLAGITPPPLPIIVTRKPGIFFGGCNVTDAVLPLQVVTQPDSL
jgi:hypothetical protein